MIENFFNEIIKILNSEHPIRAFFESTYHVLSYIWNYQIFVTAAKEKILVANVLISIVLLIIGLRYAKHLSKLVRKKILKNMDFGTATSLERLSHYFFMALIAIFILDISNVPLTVFTVIGTTLALGIGLGSKNIAENFISGIIIMIERPIKLGDIIEMKDIIGEVTDIGARCVSIQTDKNITILVPNSNILQDVIINWTHEDTTLKSSLNFRIDNELEIDEIDKIILDAFNKNPKILKNPEPIVLFKEISKDTYDIEVEFWIDLSSDSKGKYINNDINRTIAKMLKQYNISDEEKLKQALLSDK